MISTSSGYTTTWKMNLHSYFEKLKNEREIKEFYFKLKVDINSVNVHLAIFKEPFISLIFEGKKTIESRFSKNKISPFNEVFRGDFIFIKKSGGDVLGYFIVGDTEYYSYPGKSDLLHIEKSYGDNIGTFASENFWEARSSARYISLIGILNTKKITPFHIDKKNRQGWAVIDTNNEKT